MLPTRPADAFLHSASWWGAATIHVLRGLSTPGALLDLPDRGGRGAGEQKSITPVFGGCRILCPGHARPPVRSATATGSRPAPRLFYACWRPCRNSESGETLAWTASAATSRVFGETRVMSPVTTLFQSGAKISKIGDGRRTPKHRGYRVAIRGPDGELLPRGEQGGDRSSTGGRPPRLSEY